jgi:drug/metabolite transporter (DMT)-like permease
MKTIGIVLVIAGVIALVYGGFAYSRDRKVLDLGPLEITTTENRSFPIPAAVGAAVLVAGFVLVISGNRRSRPL